MSAMDRGKHYTEKDKLDFIDIVQQFKHILENRRVDGVSIKDKNNCWKDIVKYYNSTQPQSGPRTKDQLRMLYKNLKRRTRIESAQARAQALRTVNSIFTRKSDLVPDKISVNMDDSDTSYLQGTEVNEVTGAAVGAADSEAGKTNNAIAGVENFLTSTSYFPSTSNGISEGSGSRFERIHFDSLVTDVSNLSKQKIKISKTKERTIKKLRKLQFENELKRKQCLEVENRETLRLMKLKQRNELLKRKYLLAKIKKLDSN